MLNYKFYPKVIQEILKNLPTVAFKCVDWKKTLIATKSISKNFILNKMGQKIIEKQNGLSGDFINCVKNESFPVILQKNQAHYENILKFFFTQLKNDEGISLDLRSKNFGIRSEILTFSYNNLSHQFNNDFRENLIILYKAFYQEDKATFNQMLKTLGLATNCNEEEINELSKLMKQNFGTDITKMKFSLSSFQDSFFEIFNFFVNKEITIPADFLFLGLNLVTLFENLDEYGKEINVKQVFQEVFPS